MKSHASFIAYRIHEGKIYGVRPLVSDDGMNTLIVASRRRISALAPYHLLCGDRLLENDPPPTWLYRQPGILHVGHPLLHWSISDGKSVGESDPYCRGIVQSFCWRRCASEITRKLPEAHNQPSGAFPPGFHENGSDVHTKGSVSVQARLTLENWRRFRRSLLWTFCL
jgi:hypothetical protein